MEKSPLMSSPMTDISHLYAAVLRKSIAQVKLLLIVLLSLVTMGATAAVTKFSFNVTMDGPFNLNANETMNLSNFADITGGTAEIVNPTASTVNIIDSKSSTYHITLRTSYVHIHLNRALQAGEVISFESYNRDCDLYITSSNETQTSNIVLTASTNAGNDADNRTYYSGSYTVASNDGIQGTQDIYLWNKTRTYIRTFSIQGLSYNYTLNAIDGNNNVLKAIATGEVGDQAVTVYYPKFIKYNNKYYSTSASTFAKTFEAATSSAAQTETVTYTEATNVVAVLEGEDAVSNGDKNATYSNGSSGHVAGDVLKDLIDNLPRGKYTMHVCGYNNFDGSFRSVDLRNKDVTDISINLVTTYTGNTAGNYSVDFNIYGSRSLGITGYINNQNQYNQSGDFDYIYIESKNETVTNVTGIDIYSGSSKKTNQNVDLRTSGGNVTLTASEASAASSDVKWTSSDKNIAEVEDGVVTDKTNGAGGVVTITASLDGGALKASCTVTIFGNKTTDGLADTNSDWSYEPTEGLVSGVLYENNRLLSDGSSTFSNGGLLVKTARNIVMKLNTGATLKVTYRNDTNGSKNAQIGSSKGGYQYKSEAVSAGETKTVTCYPNNGIVYINASSDLYVTKIEVIYTIYTVTYNTNGKSGTLSPNNTYDTETNAGDGFVLPTFTPTEVIYSFLGWATNATAAEPNVTGVTGNPYHPTGTNNSITLYAVFQKQDALKSVVVNGHTLVVSERSSGASEDDTYTYSIGNAWGQSTIPVTITPVSTAKATVGLDTSTNDDDATSTNNGDAITVNVPINGEPQEISVTNGTSTSKYYIKINEATNISFSGDSYAIENKTYYEGQIIDGTHIDAYISPTAGGNDHNSAGSTYGVLTGKNLSSSYSGDITYSNQLWNSRGNNAVWDPGNFVPTYGAYYVFEPSVSGTLEVAVNLGANKTLYVSDGTQQLTYGTDYNTSVALNNGALAETSNLSIYINVDAGKTYYVYANKTKIGLLGFALNAGWLHVVEDRQEYILSTDNYNAHSYFTKTNAGTTTNYKDVTIYRIKNTDDKVSVKVKDATAVQAVINNNGNNRNFTVAVDGTIQGTETANGETTSSYYAISKSGSTVTLAGTGSDLYAYKLIFYRNTPSIINVTKSSEKLTTDTLYVDSGETSYTVTTNNSTGDVSMDASAVSSFATAVLTSSNGSHTLKVTPVGSGKTGSGIITLSQDASGDYSAGETQFLLAVRKHGLTLTLTHDSHDHYTYNEDSSTKQDGSFYAATSHATYTNGSTSTAWTVTAKNDKDGAVSCLTGYKYYSDDKSVATVDLETGKVTMASTPFGTTNIIVLYEGNDNYEAAKAEFPIKVTSGIDVMIPKDDKPYLNKKYSALNTSGDTLCTMIAGGYKYNGGILFGDKDGWSKAGPYDDASKFTCQLDGFINQSQAEVDSHNEFNQEIEWYEEYASTDTYHKNPLMRRIKPFTLPVRGAYLKFEPTVNGILTAYVLQNGDITYENEGGDGLPISVGKAPRAYYWFDQDGYRIEPTHYVSKLPLHYGRDYTKNGRQVFFDNDDTDKRHKLGYWYNNNAGLQDLYETSTVDENGNVTKEAMWPTQAQVNANLARVIPDPQPVVRYANGFSVHQKAYVKYQLNVVAGNTYYFFSNVSKVGFAGYNFKQDDSALPTAYNGNGEQYSLTVTRKTESQTMKPSGYDADVLTTFKPSDANHINQYDQITFNRTFKIGTWNTITLPFSLTETQVEKVFGVGTILVTYNGVAQSGGHNTAFFLRHVDQNILAGQPYFIKPTGKDWSGSDLSNVNTIEDVKYVGGNGGLTFKGVNVDFNLAAQNYERDTYVGSGTCAYKDTDLKCVGTLARTAVKTNDYYINAKTGQLVEYTGGGTDINAYRAFLQQPENGSAQVKLAAINYSGLDGVDWEAEATGIMEVLVNDMGVEIAPVQGVFNLNGQKVGDSTKGLPAGLYIVNGKVINIK